MDRQTYLDTKVLFTHAIEKESLDVLESLDMSRQILSIVPEEKAHHDSSRKRAWVSLHLGLPSTVTLPSLRHRIRRNAAAATRGRRSC